MDLEGPEIDGDGVYRRVGRGRYRGKEGKKGTKGKKKSFLFLFHFYCFFYFLFLFHLHFYVKQLVSAT